MKATHKSELEAVRQLVKGLGGAVYVAHQGAGPRGKGGYRGLHGSAGIPDLECFVPMDRLSARLYAPWWEHKPDPETTMLYFRIEVKVGKDKLSDQQAEYKRLAENAGIAVIVGGLAELASFLGVQIT